MAIANPPLDTCTNADLPFGLTSEAEKSAGRSIAFNRSSRHRNLINWPSRPGRAAA